MKEGSTLMGKKELLERALDLINHSKALQVELRQVASELGKSTRLKNGGSKKFKLGEWLFTLSYHPASQSPDRQWNLSLDEMETVE